MTLDEVLSQRERINEIIRTRLDQETGRWGIKVTNVEIREIEPPTDIQTAMTRQMSAERMRRSMVLEADGQKEADITVAEGQKQSEILKAEGARQAEILKAEGDQQAAVLRASGFAEALQRIQDTASGLGGNTMTLQYMDALKEMAAGESTKFVLAHGDDKTHVRDRQRNGRLQRLFRQQQLIADRSPADLKRRGAPKPRRFFTFNFGSSDPVNCRLV